MTLGVAVAAAATPGEIVRLVHFENTPFPYRGALPDDASKPFLDVTEGDRAGHTSARGGVYWEDVTYSERRALIAIPPKFDLRRPALIVVFLHGNQATLERDVRDRQQVPQQLADAQINAILVAPQFALDALDSSAGRFWERGVFSNFLDETADRVAQVQGGPRMRAALRKAQVIIVAYSGGYQAAAFALSHGGADHRVHGIVLLDALYGQEDKFANWITRHRGDAFFFSTYTEGARASNETLQGLLQANSVQFGSELPPRLRSGSVAFQRLPPDTEHNDVVTQAWGPQPLADVLRRVAGYVRVARKR